MQNNKQCPTCRFYDNVANFCRNQGSSYYYCEVPDKEIGCRKFLENPKVKNT